jgi:peptidoglycan/LPS O-acetylase OafA/YrhL
LFELDIILLPILIWNLALTIFLFIKWYFNIWIQKLAKFLKFSWEISYSLYLQNFLFLTWWWHIFNKFIFSHYWHNLFVEIILMIFVLCLMYLFAYLSYKLIEQPWIALWKKIIQKYSK